MTWPTQGDGRAWCFYDAYNWRWAVVEDAGAMPQKWRGILDSGQLFWWYALERVETMTTLVWGDGFEGDFYWQTDPFTGEEGNASHTYIPIGWTARWVKGMDENVRPEWAKCEPPQVEVIEGRQSAHVHTAGPRHHTVLYRQIPAEVGAKYQLRATVIGDSQQGSGHAIAVGIDPYGGTNWGGEDPRWGWYGWDSKPPVWENGKKFELMTPIVQAEATRITLYLRSWCRFAAPAAAIFDDVQLWADEGKPPDPDPEHPPQPGEPVDYDRIKDETATEVINRWMLLVDKLRVRVGDE